MSALTALRLPHTILAVLAALWSASASADPQARLVALDGVAVAGFDPVAFFVDGRALSGQPEIALRWRGVRWHFASPGHRAAFEADPHAYAPQFGGYCALSVARGRPVPADPRYWAIMDGRLYLAEGPGPLALLLASPAETVHAAQQNWPRWLAGGD